MRHKSIDSQISKIMATIDVMPEYVAESAVYALNRTATAIRSTTSKKITREKRLKAGVMLRRIKVWKAREDFTRARVDYLLGNIFVRDFKDKKQTARGVVAGGVLYPRAFIAKMRSTATEGVYRRVGKPRLPIRSVRADIYAEVEKIVEDMWDKEGRNLFEYRFLQRLSEKWGYATPAVLNSARKAVRRSMGKKD